MPGAEYREREDRSADGFLGDISAHNLGNRVTRVLRLRLNESPSLP